MAACPAKAQTAAPNFAAGTYGPYNPYSATGQYGMAFGAMSYGVPRTYTTFSSPYGGGYGYGYAPYSYASNQFGVGLWRPGMSVPGYMYESSMYRTIPPFRPLSPTPTPPVGYYAPAFGPPSFYAW